MKFELNTLPRNSSKEELIAEIKRVDLLIDKDKIITKDFNNFSKLTAQSIRKKFGGWENALMAAGLGHKYSGPKISKKMCNQSKKLTDEEVLVELKRVANLLKQNYVTQENLNTHSEIISASTIVYRFGSYEEGLKRAGLNNSPGYRGKFSNEDYFENLLNVWTKLGRQPFMREIDAEPSNISSGAYERRFGSWRKALEAFVNRMNQEDSVNVELPSKKFEELQQEKIGVDFTKCNNSVENRRDIPLGLRYKVLKRDNFKCVRCGRSPATNHGVELHIDHKLPFSKGGKTILENLETKCKECNLGKSNRHIE